MQTLARNELQLIVALAGLTLIVGLTQPKAAVASTIQVTTTQQGITNGLCSLQEAIYASEFKSNTALGSANPNSYYTTGCTAGTGDDTIVLPPGVVFTFDHFWDGDTHNIFGPTATPIIVSKITIEGNGATLRWVDRDVSINARLFTIATVADLGFPSGTGNVTLRNVYVKDFHIKGGDGGTGGGGGLGAGGAIFVAYASLTVENSTFENNGAVGGNGAGGLNGGGGGLSGNGGEGCFFSGGGGGGSRGDGGNGVTVDHCVGLESRFGGGGGGGSVFSGEAGTVTGTGGNGGFRCGGNGGDAGKDGQNASCPGGGGGGGGVIGWAVCGVFQSCDGHGGRGHFGGGGGGRPGGRG
jgi:hypothetical protein